jgi:hypothetical protein
MVRVAKREHIRNQNAIWPIWQGDDWGIEHLNQDAIDQAIVDLHG